MIRFLCRQPNARWDGGEMKRRNEGRIHDFAGTLCIVEEFAPAQPLPTAAAPETFAGYPGSNGVVTCGEHGENTERCGAVSGEGAKRVGAIRRPVPKRDAVILAGQNVDAPKLSVPFRTPLLYDPFCILCLYSFRSISMSVTSEFSGTAMPNGTLGVLSDSLRLRLYRTY